VTLRSSSSFFVILEGERIPEVERAEKDGIEHGDARNVGKGFRSSARLRINGTLGSLESRESSWQVDQRARRVVDPSRPVWV
jgi:hypothetical protein